MTIPVSSLANAPALQASKWLKSAVLLSSDEMQALLNELNPTLVLMGGVVTGDPIVPKSKFLSDYDNYLKKLSLGEEAVFPALSWTHDLESLRLIPLDEGRCLIRIVQPVVQMQPHHMEYSEEDKKFHSMIYGKESLSWGVQFSYPQIYETPQKEILQVGPQFQNTQLFKSLQKWLRAHSMPTPFVVEGQKLNIPVRIGKTYIQEASFLPQIQKRGLAFDHS